jgi:DNA-binding NtrC family response regulator
MTMTTPITFPDYNLYAAERLLCERALDHAGSIVEAAKLLGVTRHALKRRIIKHNIRWTRDGGRIATAPPTAA